MPVERSGGLSGGDRPDDGVVGDAGGEVEWVLGWVGRWVGEWVLGRLRLGPGGQRPHHRVGRDAGGQVERVRRRADCLVRQRIGLRACDVPGDLGRGRALRRVLGQAPAHQLAQRLRHGVRLAVPTCRRERDQPAQRRHVRVRLAAATDDAEPDHPRAAGRHHHLARVQVAVPEADRVDRRDAAGDGRRQLQHRRHRQRAVLADDLRQGRARDVLGRHPRRRRRRVRAEHRRHVPAPHPAQRGEPAGRQRVDGPDRGGGTGVVVSQVDIRAQAALEQVRTESGRVVGVERFQHGRHLPLGN